MPTGAVGVEVLVVYGDGFARGGSARSQGKHMDTAIRQERLYVALANPGHVGFNPVISRDRDALAKISKRLNARETMVATKVGVTVLVNKPGEDLALDGMRGVGGVEKPLEFAIEAPLENFSQSRPEKSPDWPGLFKKGWGLRMRRRHGHDP